MAPLLGLRPDFRHHSRQDQECGSGFNTTRLEEDRVGQSRTESDRVGQSRTESDRAFVWLGYAWVNIYNPQD